MPQITRSLIRLKGVLCPLSVVSCPLQEKTTTSRRQVSEANVVEDYELTNSCNGPRTKDNGRL